MKNPLSQGRIDTLLLHADRELNPTAAVVPPIYQTANYAGTSAEDFLERSSQPRHPEFYTRYRNPNSAQVETVLATLEGAEAGMLVGSGMAAISLCLLGVLRHGDHVVAQTAHYGGTLQLLRDVLPRFGMTTTQVDQRDVRAFERALRPQTRVILLESPSNPVMQLTDLRAVAELARSRGIFTVIDSTLATPLNQRPLELGIDLVMHSATKYFGGHSDLIAGVILGRAELIERLWNLQVVLGAAIAPFDAWLILRGLRTLALRMQRHNENALALATFLAGHPAVNVVHYPGLPQHPQHELAKRQMSGFGGMLSFEVHGGSEAAKTVMSKLRLPRLAGSLGAVESLVVLPAANFSHYLGEEQAKEAGIAPGLVRVSVGLESAADLIADFEQALSQLPHRPP
jgi:methionine-gamma-lyase